MAGDFLHIDVSDIQRIRAKFGRLHSLLQDEGTDEANQYILNKAREYAPYRYVTRVSAYGTPWFSEKQRRRVMAMIHDGEITPGRPNRSQKLRGGWRIIGSGVGSFVANEEPHAMHVQGNSGKQQSRHAKKIGWKGVDVIIKENAGQIARRFSAGVKRAIRILGL